MRAGVYLGPKCVGIESRALPEPGSGEARVKVHACGICGSDLHLFHSPEPFVEPGVVMGHEMAGVVDAIGPEVTGWKPGDRVTVEPLKTCGECRWCRAGRDSICPSFSLYGFHHAGGFADYINVQAKRLYAVPDELTFDTASLAEPVAVTVHGLRIAGFTAGQRVMVIGAGTIGLATVAVAKAWGAGEIVLTSRHRHQSELGEELGASRVLTDAEATEEVLASNPPEDKPEIVVETVGGSANTLRLGAAAVAPGGTVSVLGVFLGELKLEPWSLLFKEVKLQWSSCYTRSPGPSDFEESLRLLKEHSETWSGLLTHRLPLDEIAQGFALASDKTSGAVKVTMTP